MSALTESINVEEKFSGSSLNGRQEGSLESANNLFAPDSSGEFDCDGSNTLNGAENAIDPRVGTNLLWPA